MTEKENKVNQLAKEVSDLNFKIKLDTIKLKKIKEQLIDLMVNENVSEIITDTSKIKKSKWSVRFSTQLRKEFNKLEDKKKEELLSKGLIKIQYKLNTKNFGELKNKQEKTELDEYIIDKKNQIFLTIKLKSVSNSCKLEFTAKNLDTPSPLPSVINLSTEFIRSLWEKLT